MAPEVSFVLKRGEGLHDANLIKHKVLNVETPRASNVDSTPKMAPLAGPKAKASSVDPTPKMATPVGLDGTKVVKSSYISPMARARAEKKRREAGQSKDWDETSSTPSSEISSISNDGTPPSKPARLIPYSGGPIPASGNLIPSSGYIPKPRDSTVSEGLVDSGRLPKFGVWDNLNDASGPCYTLLFENVAQEKRIGHPIRVHGNRPASPARSEDLYTYNPGDIKVRKNKQLHHSLFCCFVRS